jgi:hypothetical protein
MPFLHRKASSHGPSYFGILPVRISFPTQNKFIIVGEGVMMSWHRIVHQTCSVWHGIFKAWQKILCGSGLFSSSYPGSGALVSRENSWVWGCWFHILKKYRASTVHCRLENIYFFCLELVSNGHKCDQLSLPQHINISRTNCGQWMSIFGIPL